ncbi:MAG: tRNA pseudouridine(38-40) synthase TruA [Flavisolibacter sp.]|nr:tRNA pseudouridine(38-40) synthase TruA [Flavisolibacter sp.]
MARYFLEVAYKGTRYSGFQVQQNANTIQAEVEKAFNILHGLPTLFSPQGVGPGVRLTGCSRTDAGVHALQNYFHFDFDKSLHPQFLFKINAILPNDIVIKNVHAMPPAAHARFDAVSREYEYRLYQKKNPFLSGAALYYPYKIDKELMNEAAAIVKDQTNFFAFTKTNTQVSNFNCSISRSKWLSKGDLYIYYIAGNRFLRGMVRLLTASMLLVGRHKLSFEDFTALFKTTTLKSGASVAASGLYLIHVHFPDDYFGE